MSRLTKDSSLFFHYVATYGRETDREDVHRLREAGVERCGAKEFSRQLFADRFSAMIAGRRRTVHGKFSTSLHAEDARFRRGGGGLCSENQGLPSAT